MLTKTEKIAVLGAGSWGSTMAILLANKGFPVTMWVYQESQLKAMQSTRRNEDYLPGIDLPKELLLTGNAEEAVSDAHFIVTAVPSHAMRQVCGQIAPFTHDRQIVVNLSKGIENDTLLRMSEVIGDMLPISSQQIASVYGPSHAEEVSKEIATAVVAASLSLDTARLVRELFRTDFFRVYSSQDVIGVEIGGSLKNVVAIAAGICDGAGFGDNTKAALLTRALVEMTRIGEMLGANKETFSGLSGMGDLIVTCMSRHSRNRFVGEQIGKGRKLDDVLAEMRMIAEGVKTTRSAHQLSQRLGVEMPILEQVYQTLFHDKSAHDGVADLMQRDPKEEQ